MSGLVEHNDWFAHETAVIDEGCSIGAGSRIWHFSHTMPGAVLGEACNIGQNVVISPDVVLGRNCKVQNNVSLYTGVTCEDDVFLGPSCVFTNVTNPRSAGHDVAEVPDAGAYSDGTSLVDDRRLMGVPTVVFHQSTHLL